MRPARCSSLGLAFTVLAATYLAIQYMLALQRTWFLIVLARGRDRRADPAAPGAAKPQGFAAVVLGVQAAAALLAFGLALRHDRPPRPTAVQAARDDAKATTQAAPAGVGSR